MFVALFKWLRDLDTKKIGAQVLGNLRNMEWRRMEKIKWSEKVTNRTYKMNRNCKL